MIYDLSHPIRVGMPAYPGDPPVRIEPWPDAAPWQVSAVSLGSHSGTHVDAPRHIDPRGRSIDTYPIERFVGSGIVVDAPNLGDNEAIAAEVLTGDRISPWPGSFVVLRTGWDRYWGQDRYLRHPYIGSDLVAALTKLGVGLIGIDVLSVDSSVDGGSTVHATLLGADILIVENLRNLVALSPGNQYDFVLAPLALDRCDGAPVRAVAIDTEQTKDRSVL